MNRTAICILVLFTTPALSQDKVFVFDDAVDTWTANTGIVLTSAGQNLAIKDVAMEVSALAVADGVNERDAAKWSAAFQESGFIEITDVNIVSKGLQGEVALPYSTGMKAANLETSLTFTAMSVRLWKMPRIKVVVEPIPPRDYTIEINGENVLVTERSEYGVEPGLVRIKVTRANKSDCLWEGKLEVGDVHPLNCKM